MTGEGILGKWLEQQESLGKTRDEIVKNWLVYGGTVYRLTKSGKTKYNLKVQVGCVDLNEFEKTLNEQKEG